MECTPADSGLRFSANVSAIYTVPRFESNPAYSTTTIRSQGLMTPTLVTREQTEFEYNYAFTPRITLAVENAEGLGARVRWWRYDQSATNLTTTNDSIPLGSAVLARTMEGVSPLLSSGPQTGLPAVFSLQQQGVSSGTDILTFSSRMYMDVWDFEGTLSDLHAGRWSFLLAGGLRYAQVHHEYNSFLQGAVPQFLLSHQSFEGVGPTIALEAHRPVLLPGLSLYGTGRVAMLFGQYTHSVEGRNIGLTPPFNLQDQLSTDTVQRFLPAIEMELGTEYTAPLGSAEFVLQSGVVSQLWPAGNGAHPYGNMGLIGFTLNAGVRY